MVHEKKVREAFTKVKVDINALERRLEALEGDIMHTIKSNMKELKDKLADGSITAHEYDERHKRILDWDLR